MGDGVSASSECATRPVWVKPLAFFVVLAVLVALGWTLGWGDWIASGRLRDALSSLVAQNYVLACIVFCVASIAGSVVFALPGVLFALAAGAVFGPVAGTLLCWGAMTVGACGAFAVGRYFLKDALKPRLARSARLNALLFEGAGRSDVFLLAVTRLVPIFPFNLQNFAYGITDIGFVPYALYTALFILPGTAAYTLAAAGVVDAEGRAICLAAAAVLVAASVAVALLLKSKAGVS